MPASPDMLSLVREELTQYMNRKRCRKTPERYALIDAVYTIGKQFTIDSMQEYVSQNMRISRVTVYNNLEMFVKAGLVVKHPTPSMVFYEACYASPTHHQLLCTVCGATTEFLDANITDYVMSMRFKKFFSSNCSVTVYGVCAKCRARQNREKKKLRDKLGENNK
ncbi:MAG: transcriptional repressor [Prevotellaceae bacterium]|nr:transcriptional repressor [Candidatus Colivivens caballi]